VTVVRFIVATYEWAHTWRLGVRDDESISARSMHAHPTQGVSLLRFERDLAGADQYHRRDGSHQEQLLRGNLFGEIVSKIDLTSIRWRPHQKMRRHFIAAPYWWRSDLMAMCDGVVKCSGSNGAIQTIADFF
jgi:hypothetical protein